MIHELALKLAQAESRIVELERELIAQKIQMVQSKLKNTEAYLEEMKQFQTSFTNLGRMIGVEKD